MYLLTLTGIYDHGVLGVFTKPDDARSYAKELHEKSDGYHEFRLEEIELDKRIEPKEDLCPLGRKTEMPFGAAFNWVK